jgi:hypothetical protein
MLQKVREPFRSERISSHIESMVVSSCALGPEAETLLMPVRFDVVGYLR